MAKILIRRFNDPDSELVMGFLNKTNSEEILLDFEIYSVGRSVVVKARVKEKNAKKEAY